MGATGNEIRDAFIRVCTLDELKAKGKMVVSGGRCPLLVIYDEGEVRALDNRCPHLGFPLHRGSVEDGILTCHWHHARFDLSSGATFDLWADDVPTCPVEIRGGEVWVGRDCRHADEAGHWRRRLGDGMAHNIGLVIAKAVLGLKAAGTDDAEIIRQAALFGARNRDGWGTGLTVLTALGNLIPALPEDETYLAFYKGIRRVASDCAGETPHRAREKLGAKPPPFETLKRWLRHWTLVRHRDGAERTLLTAIASGAIHCPFLMFTIAPVSPAATKRSVCRHRSAGIWMTSTTPAARRASSGVCTSVSTGTPTASRTAASMSSPASIPGPRTLSPLERFALS